MLAKLKSHILLLTIIAIAILVRFVNLNQSLWLDEAAQALESTRPLSQQLDIVGDFQPPLFHIVVFLFAKVSHADWWLRLASVIPGIVTIYFAYKIAKENISKQIANLTAIFGSLSAYHYYFSQELRPYSLAAMVGTMSMYFYLEFIKSKSKNANIPYIITSIFSLYATYLTPFLIVSQLLTTAMLFRKKINAHCKQLLWIIVGFLPWVPFFLKQLSVGIGLKSTYLGWAEAVSLPWFKSLPLTAIRFLIGMIRVDLTMLQLLAFGAIFVGLGYFIIKLSKTKASQALLIWLIAPTLFAFVISFAVPVLEPKRLLFSLPALWIFFALILEKFKSNFMLQKIFIAIYAIPLMIHLFSPTLLREDWKSSVDYIQTTATQSSVVMFAFPQPFAPFRWYQDNSVPTVSTGLLTVPNKEYLDEITKDALLYDQVFVYDYLMDLSDPNRLIYSWLQQNGYQEVSVKDFHGVGFVKVFQKNHPVALKYE